MVNNSSVDINLEVKEGIFAAESLACSPGIRFFLDTLFSLRLVSKVTPSLSALSFILETNKKFFHEPRRIVFSEGLKMLYTRRRRKAVRFTSNEHHWASKAFSSNVAFESKFGEFSIFERTSINRENASGSGFS